MSPLPHALSDRALLAISGADALPFLQGLLTQDVSLLARDGIQFAALLSPQGKILHDMFLVADGSRLLLDVAAGQAALLCKRLQLYKLRAQVTIADASDRVQVSLLPVGRGGMADPRHPALPYRLYAADRHPEALSAAEARAAMLAAAVPDSAVDFAPDSVVAMDAGYDLLHGISFTKGCYVGQEVIARMHYKQIARKGFYRLTAPNGTQRLALLKFEDVGREGPVTLDSAAYHATLAEWLLPKFAQFEEAHSS